MTGIRRAMPVVFTDDPQGSRAFYEDFLGFRVAMAQDGFLMFQSPTVPTTQVMEIVYPLTDEPWGIRRFFVREPNGRVVNVTSHIADLAQR